ncbi:hypothetical protein CCYA_CCYA07G1989 [Cyanidiococcus yangmingshanensis]|nr:hypothetical protein CCYA_CCYA07G1989 [Cyanidiococcus yangmingshanensis]
MRSVLDLKSSWDGWIVFGTLLAQVRLVWVRGGPEAIVARTVLTLSLLTLGAALVSSILQSSSGVVADRGRQEVDGGQQHPVMKSGALIASGCGTDTISKRLPTARHARDQGLVVGLLLPFLCVTAVMRRELVTPAETFSLLCMAFAPAWHAAWTLESLNRTVQPSRRLCDGTLERECHHRIDRSMGLNQCAKERKLSSLRLTEGKRRERGRMSRWQRAGQVLWLYIVPVFILRELSGSSWESVISAVVISMIIWRALFSDAFEGTFTYGEALLVSFLAAAAWSAPSGPLQIRYTLLSIDSIGKAFMKVLHRGVGRAIWRVGLDWRLWPTGDNDVLGHPTQGSSPFASYHLLQATTCADEWRLSNARFGDEHERLLRVTLWNTDRRLMQRFLLKASVELAIGGTVLVTKWHQWMGRRRKVAPTTFTEEVSVRGSPLNPKPGTKWCSLDRHRRLIGLVLPVMVFLPPNYTSLLIALEAQRASWPSSVSVHRALRRVEPATIVWYWVREEPRVLGLVLYWFFVLAVGIGALGPHRWRWRRIMARKYYHFMALLLFLPVFTRDDPELWLFLAFAQTVAFTVLILFELTRVSGVLASAREASSSRNVIATRLASGIGTDEPLMSSISSDRGQDSSSAQSAHCETHGRGQTDRSFYTAIHRFMTALVDERDEGSVIVSHLYLLLGCAAPGWVLLSSFERWQASNCSMSSVLTEWSSGLLSLGVFDTAACMLGNCFGKHHWPRSRKTFEGSLGGFVSAWLVHHMLLAWHESGQSSVTIEAMVGFSVALFLCMIFEALTAQNDNLVLPVFCFATLALLPTGCAMVSVGVPQMSASL